MPESDGQSAAPRAGADLRAARERLGWPIEQLSRSLHIRLAHLEALEEGRIDLLPGNAYAVGFLRTYAATLGLDPNEIVRRFKAEAGEVNRRTELVFPAPMPQRGLPAGAVVLLGVVLAIAAYAGWYRLSGEGRLPAETVTPVPQRLATLADQAVPPAHLGATPAQPAAGAQGQPAPGVAARAVPAPAGPASPAVDAAGAASPARAPAPATLASAVPAAGPATTPPAAAPAPPLAAAPPVPTISPTSAAAAPVPPLSTVPAIPAAPAAAAPAPAAVTPEIVLAATADAWMEVRDGNGNVLLNRVLHAGDSWPVPALPGLVLATGNAGGTEIVVDGISYPVPGGSGAVRRGLPLDAELIKAGKLAQSAPSTTGTVGPSPAAFSRPASQ